MPGSVEVCTRLFVDVVKVCAAAPMAIRAMPNSTPLGISAAQPTPKTAAPASTTGIPGLVLVAAIKAPATDPAAIIDLSHPYWLAPAWKMVTDMVKMKIGKFNPTRNSMNRTVLRLDRRQT
jgi:hypothetical protein